MERATNSRPISLVIIAAILSFQDGCLGQDKGGCQFWYFVVPPAEVDWCNPDGVDTPLFCGVYVPQNVPTSVEWYRSQTENLAGVSGTLIIEDPLKYLVEVSRSTDPVVNGIFMGLLYDQHSLRIMDFNQSDDGYYWCQLIANETTELDSSPAGYVAVNSIPVSCFSSDIRYFNIIDEGLCAQISPPPSPTMASIAPTPVALSSSVHPGDSVSSLVPRPRYSVSLSGGSLLSVTVLPTQTQSGSNSGEDHIPFYIGIGVVAGAGLIITVVVFVVVCVSRGKKEKPKGGINEDIQLQPCQTTEGTYAAPYHPTVTTQAENRVTSGYTEPGDNDRQQLLKITNPDHECNKVREQNATNTMPTASHISRSSSSVPPHLVSCATVLNNIQDHTYEKVQYTTSEESAP